MAAGIERPSFGSDQDRWQGAGRPWTVSVWLFVASLAVNIAAVFFFRGHGTIATIDADEREYWDLASRFHDLGLSGIAARRTPAFPGLLATLRTLLGDNYLSVQIALSALIAISPVLLYWVVRRHLENERVARIAGIGFLLWPQLVRYGATLYSDSIALTMFLVFLLSWPRRAMPKDMNAHRCLQYIVAGGLLGLCVQMKPLYLIYTPIAFILAIYGHKSLKWRAYAGACLIAGCIVVCLPWSAYLSAREGRFIAISANDGETLAGGLNPALLALDKSTVFVAADGRTTWVGPGKWLPMETTGYLSAREFELPYAQATALLRQRAQAWIVSHPADAAYITARKLLYMWGVYPFWNGAQQTLLGNIPLLLLIGAAAASLWLNRGNLPRLALFWTLPLFSSAVCLISWGSWRFRMPADVGLIVLAAMLFSYAHASQKNPG